jgi:hypothetical protein
MVDMDTRQRTNNLLIGFYRWPREQLFYKEETTIGQPEETSQDEPTRRGMPLKILLKGSCSAIRRANFTDSAKDRMS